MFYNEDTKDRYYHRPKMMAGICKRAGIEPIGTTRRKIGRGKKGAIQGRAGLLWFPRAPAFRPVAFNGSKENQPENIADAFAPPKRENDRDLRP